MSIETWRAEFYPIRASGCPQEQAAAHSLQKWIGLRPENLTKHGCNTSEGYVTDGSGSNGVRVDGATCALCHWYLKKKGVYELCKKCPLSIVRGGFACDERNEEEDHGPWHSWTYDDNPEPMIKWLEKTVDYLKEQPK